MHITNVLHAVVTCTVCTETYW